MAISPVRHASGRTDSTTVRDDLRQLFGSGRTRDVQWRLRQLRGIERLCDEREQEIAAALAEDLDRSAVEAWLGDVASTKGEAAYARKHLKKWVGRQRQSLPAAQRPGRGWVQYDPLGVVLIIGPWNYPVYLNLAPLVGAVAAGNCAVIKPSELAPATSSLLARLVPKYLDSDAVRVIEGDAQITQDLLAQGFDHVLFTGGTEVGKKIMAAAAATLTPVTLELGGKSPVIVTADADLDVAARRIASVKLANSGQMCIAPDYVLADRSIVEALVDKLVTTIAAFRSDQADPSLRVINRRQFDRLTAMLDATKGQVICGGGSDPGRLRIEPTIVVDPPPDDALMTDEIFGPILPVLSLNRPTPPFNSSTHDQRRWRSTYSPHRPSMVAHSSTAFHRGAQSSTHIAMHCLVPQLPFGGVGASGIGAYHGRWGFEALSHRRAVLIKRTWPDPRLLYPPHTARALRIMRKLL